MDIKNLRKEYQAEELRRHAAASNPFEQFDRWFEQALAAQVDEPNALALATADRSGKPSCRTVLMKQFDREGLVYFTNGNSRKAREVRENPFGSALFFWHELARQVTIEGDIATLPRDETEAYFDVRPRGSQLGAWASDQDAVITSREQLEERFAALEQQYAGKKVPCPPFWSGFRLTPRRFEFWQGRLNRLHDRLAYIWEQDQWKLYRLSP